ncbi:oligosaccharide flippase family protein [Weeksellaceae bacterium TAE3-ERU29]|nr:oligosaccharide flippase family protein [Weeksellaceae bacterium TAE3-ERU29]
MGIVARQGIKYSIVGYLGFLLGTLAVIYIFPNDIAFYGKLRFIMASAEMLLPIVVFGVSFSNVKFFNQARKENRHQNFLSISLGFVVFNFVVFSLLYFLINLLFPSLENSELWRMKMLIFPLILIMALSSVLNKYISNYKRIAIPNIFQNLFPKLANLGAFCLFFYLGFSEKFAYSFFLGMFVLALFGYVLYANKLEQITPNFSLDYIKKNQRWKEILNYSFYGFLGNIGYFIAFRIDNFMIGELINFEENGVYSIIMATLSFIMIPQMGINSISAPIINQSIENKDFKGLNIFYKKTSLNLFSLGLVLFCCILVGFPFLTDFIKNGDKLLAAQSLIWILGSSMLFDLATGFNGDIISLSKYYRFNIVMMLFLATLTVTLNLLFIYFTDLGIFGVALATAISLISFNILKIIFNYKKFGVSPFSNKMLYIFGICIAATGIALLLPDFNSNFLNLIYKPSVVLLLIIIVNHFAKIFPLEEYIKNLIKKNK